MSISYNPKDENFARPMYEIGSSASPLPLAPSTPTGSVCSSGSPRKKGGPSSSLMALTGASKNRRQSFGMVTAPAEMIAPSPRASPVAQQQQKPGSPASASSGPAFMKGTSSTRCRRASFDLHCLDQAGGSLSAASVLHRSYLNDQDPNAPTGRLTTSQLAANNSGASRGLSASQSAAQQHAEFLRQQYPGVDPATAAMSQRIFEQGVQNAKLHEINEDPRYSIYHPRYRMPQQVFGFSKPFIKKKDIKEQHIKSNFAASTQSYESLMTPRHIVAERDEFRKSIL
jgi:hypothetical protein